MTTKINYDELIKQGLTEYFNLEFSNIPSEDEIEHEFSEKYLREKEKLIRKVGLSYWKYVNTVAKKAAVIIVTLIIAFSSLMSVDAVREKMLDFIYEVYESFSKIQSNPYSEEKIKTHYTTSNIPELFFKQMCDTSEYKGNYYWYDTQNNYILLSQNLIESSSSFNSEDADLTEKIINNTPCLVCENEANYFCYWEFDGYRFELIYPIELGEDYMATVVGHLVEAE